MVRTLSVTADIPPSRELHLKLPADLPEGPADIVLVVSPSQETHMPTFGDLRDSEFFGMWRDRTDIFDSIDFARHLRSEGWKRPA